MDLRLAWPNRAVRQREIPKGRSNCSRMPILQGFWRVEQVVSVANGESGPRKFDPLATWADLALAVKSLYTEAHPGLLAPASLKRCNVTGCCQVQGPHPGLLAPASLKRQWLKAAPAAQQHSSGAACPGLIEAF